MKKIGKKDLVIILVIAIVFVLIIAANSNLIIRSMVNQTQQIGQTQIGSIKTDFENYIAGAENSLIRVASGAEQYLDDNDDRAGLEEYIVAQKKARLDASNEVNFNVYIAGKDWQIIPDFKAPADYHASDRNWYVGAIEADGDVYITDPYIDSMTGEMCYTVSVMLSDGETVVAMDFTLSEIQESIEKMSLSEGSSAMIVTSDGLIVGYTDMSYVGKELQKSLPEYTGVLQKAVNNKKAESFSYNLNGSRSTIFYSVTNNNWYMILCVDDSKLYSTTTWQVIINVLINLAMLAIVIILYVFAVRNRMKTEEALISRELFVNSLVEKLREPVNSIIKLRSESGETGSLSREEYDDIKSSGIRMNEIINDLSSYSSIVSNVEENKKSRKKELKDLSKTIRIFRNIIVVLLIVVMLIGSIFYYRISVRLSENLMREDSNGYVHQLEEWENEQMTILSMFTDMISAKPGLMVDYDNSVKFLDDIAKKYPSISVCYLANPYKKHTVIMNNGWKPDPDWKVEERDWYKETEKSSEGYSISSPYYDEQTGNYCITVSKIVYGQRGEFLGIFGIDLYMDKIIDIFGNSYDDLEYVFLVDSNGDIINHPNPEYQMSKDHKVNIADTPYLEAYNAGDTKLTTFVDYDGVRRCALVGADAATGFSVILVSRWADVYLYQLVYVLGFLIFLVAVIVAIILLLNKVIRSQANMNMKLSAAVKRAEAAGRAKSDFLAQMSHEIRTPINAVIGMDEMILRESDDQNIREYATDIKTASKTLLTLINGVLDFSKIESGNMEIISVKYETSELIDNLVNMISDRAAKKNLTLELDIDEKLPRVLYGDDVRIRQVVTNLLTNAVKYTEKGNVTLIMRGENISDTECILYVEVKDTGIGIKKEDMDKLFQSFRRIEETRNRTIEGTGLGMSIVDGILKLMDSELMVSSEYGKGSSFSFRISQSVVDVTPIGEYQRHRMAKAEGTLNREMKIINADILAVDDNEMNLKVVKGLMKKLEVVPDLASSGKEAVEKVRNKHYDIIFIDHMMPDMDGIETLKHLKNESLIDESTVAVALTANAIAGAKEMYISEGFMDYLSKPIAPEELDKLLEKYLPEGSCVYGGSKAADGASGAGANDGMVEDAGDGASVSMAADGTSGAGANDGTVEDAGDGASVSKAVDGTSGTDANGDSGSGGQDFVSVLSQRGVNTKAALGFAMNDEEFYKDLLVTYADTFEEKAASIKEYFDAENWNDYKIQVHALKSSSRTIGFDKLADMALEQENAAKALNAEVIKSGFEALMEEYAKAVDTIKEVL